MAIKEIPGGGFFKPKDHMDAVAILFEVKNYVPDRSTKFGVKPTIYADISVFASEEALAAGKPSSIFKNSSIEAGPLVRTLRDDVGVGNEAVSKLALVHFQKAGKDGAVLRPTDAATTNKVVAYFNQRNASLEAAIAEAPED